MAALNFFALFLHTHEMREFCNKIRGGKIGRSSQRKQKIYFISIQCRYFLRFRVHCTYILLPFFALNSRAYAMPVNVIIVFVVVAGGEGRSLY